MPTIGTTNKKAFDEEASNIMVTPRDSHAIASFKTYATAPTATPMIDAMTISLIFDGRPPHNNDFGS